MIHPEVPGTNNESERSLRGSAQDRRTVRTSKTEHGARRRTIIGSVLDSLRLHLPKPNLQAVHAQLSRWHDDGVSCFRRMVASLKIPERRLPEGVSLVLDLLVPSAETGWTVNQRPFGGVIKNRLSRDHNPSGRGSSHKSDSAAMSFTMRRLHSYQRNASTWNQRSVTGAGQRKSPDLTIWLLLLDFSDRIVSSKN